MGASKRYIKSKKKVMWRYCGSHAGRKYSSPAQYDTKAEALKAEKEFLIELASGLVGTKLTDLLKARLRDMEVRQRSEKYLKENRRYFKKLTDEFGDIAVTSITKGKMNAFLNKEAQRLQREGKTLHKANDLLRCVKAFFQWCMDFKDIEMRNPCRGIPMFPIDVKIKYVPTPWEIEDVKMHVARDYTEEHVRLVDFVEETGCRIMEAIRFRAEDIVGNQIILWTRKAKNSNLTPRYIPRPPCLDEMELPEKGRVFKRWKKYPRYLGKVTQELAKADGGEVFDFPGRRRQPWSWHNLRHNATVRWAEQGMNIYSIMSRLGHTNVMTTMGYMRSLGIQEPDKPQPLKRQSYIYKDENGHPLRGNLDEPKPY